MLNEKRNAIMEGIRQRQKRPSFCVQTDGRKKVINLKGLLEFNVRYILLFANSFLHSAVLMFCSSGSSYITNM